MTPSGNKKINVTKTGKKINRTTKGKKVPAQSYYPDGPFRRALSLVARNGSVLIRDPDGREIWSVSALSGS